MKLFFFLFCFIVVSDHSIYGPLKYKMDHPAIQRGWSVRRPRIFDLGQHCFVGCQLSFIKSTFLLSCRMSEQSESTCMPWLTGLPSDGSAGVSKERSVQRSWGGSFYPAARGASVGGQPSAAGESSLDTLAAAFEPMQFSVPLLGSGSVPVPGPSSSVGSGSVPVPGPSSSVGSGSVPVPGPSSFVDSGSVPVPGPSSSVGSGSVPVAGPSSSVGSGSVPAPGPSSSVGSGSVSVPGPSSSVGSGSVPVAGPSSSVGSGSVSVHGPSSSVGSGSVPVAGPSSSVGSGSVSVPGPSSSVGSGSVPVASPSSSVGSGSVPVAGPSSSVGSGSVPAPGPSSSADVPPQCHQRQHLLEEAWQQMAQGIEVLHQQYLERVQEIYQTVSVAGHRSVPHLAQGAGISVVSAFGSTGSMPSFPQEQGMSGERGSGRLAEQSLLQSCSNAGFRVKLRRKKGAPGHRPTSVDQRPGPLTSSAQAFGGPQVHSQSWENVLLSWDDAQSSPHPSGSQGPPQKHDMPVYSFGLAGGRGSSFKKKCYNCRQKGHRISECLGGRSSLPGLAASAGAPVLRQVRLGDSSSAVLSERLDVLALAGLENSGGSGLSDVMLDPTLALVLLDRVDGNSQLSATGPVTIGSPSR